MNFNNTAVPYRPYQFHVIHGDDPTPTSVLTQFTQKKKSQKRVRFAETVSFLLSISPRRRRRRMSRLKEESRSMAESPFPSCLRLFTNNYREL